MALVGVPRVVTGQDESGRSVFLVQETVPAQSAPALGGVEVYTLGATAADVTLPVTAGETAASTFFPQPGESRFVLVRYPGADSAEHRMPTQDDLDETNRVFPGLLDHFSSEQPGMHRTDSIDYAYIVEGEMWLQLGDGNEVRLPAGSCLIQNGTSHAWRNKSTEPALVATVLIGTPRQSAPSQP